MIKSFSRSLFITAALAGFIACGESSAPLSQTDAEAKTELSIPAIADRLVEDGNELQTLLATVNDEQSARAIEPTLREMIGEYRILFEQFDQQADLNFSDMAALAARAPKMAETQKALVQEIDRIYQNHPEATAVLRETLDRLRFSPSTP